MIGLGQAQSITSIDVEWPGGGRQTIKEVGLDQAIEIIEDQDGFRPLNSRILTVPLSNIKVE